MTKKSKGIYTAGEMHKKPDRYMSDRTATVLACIVIALVWIVFIGAIWELYNIVDCNNWQNRPLDQVPLVCVK
jgi:hypothetical protein